MRSPQSLTQRIVPALAVTVVATLLFGAVVVTADVASGDDPLLPESFAVAVPQQGDAWRYNVTLSGEWTFGLDDNLTLDEPAPFATFQWGGAGRVRGGDGFVHDANYFHVDGLAYRPLWVEEYVNESQPILLPELYITSDPEAHLGPSQDPYWNQVEAGEWIAAGSHDTISRGERFATNSSETFYGPGAGVMDEYQDTYFEQGLIEYPVGEEPCLVFNPLQGANASLAGPLVLFDACHLGGEFLTIPEGLEFQARAVEDLDGVQAIRFEARDNGTFEAWFTPSVPYPVRVAFELPSQRPDEIELGDRDLPGARSAVLDMVGFAPGAENFTFADAPSDGAPTFELAPWAKVGNSQVGMDETGLDHPFPLTEAFSEALKDTQFSQLQTFVQHYPDAYVAFASFTEGDQIYYSPQSAPPGGYSYVWTIVASSGKETLTFTAAKQDYATLAPVALRGVVGNATEAQPVYSFAQEYGYGPYYMPVDVTRTPYPGSIPATLPTVQSLAARWAAFDGSGTPLNNYGFAIGCAPNEDEQDDSCRATLQVFGGHSRYAGTSPFSGFTAPGDPYGNEALMLIERQATFAEDGTASTMFILDEREYRSSGDTAPGVTSGLPPPTTVQEPGYSVSSEQVSGIPSSMTRWVPEGKQAASVTFMGLVVGALYWVWPKLGLVGLFSRLHKSELLDHPARSRLVQIVESQPGIHFHDLAAKAELANGTAVHHLRKLSDSGHLNVRRSGRYTCYFPGGRVDPAQAAAAPLLKSGGAKQVLDAVRGKPGMSNLELAQATGLQPSTVNYHVQRLANAGLVAPLRDGRNVRLHPGARAGSLDAPVASGAAA